MTSPDLEALKALVAFVKADKRINGDVALTECRKALPALERLLASQGKPEAEAVQRTINIENTAVCYICGAPSRLSVNVLFGAAGGATLMRPVCDAHNPYQSIFRAPLLSDKLMGLVRKWKDEGAQRYGEPVFASDTAKLKCADELEALLSQEPSSGAPVTADVEPAPPVQEAGRDWYPEACPITQRPFFMIIEHPEHGMVPTYGGPYDSYTIPERDDDGDWICERYDHDDGAWVEGWESTGLVVVKDSDLIPAEPASLGAAAAEIYEWLKPGPLPTFPPFSEAAILSILRKHQPIKAGANAAPVDNGENKDEDHADT